MEVGQDQEPDPKSSSATAADLNESHEGHGGVDSAADARGLFSLVIAAVMSR